MKYLVLGATGNIGGRVTQRLIDLGERPSLFVRSAKKARASFGDQVDIHVGDLDAPGSALVTALTGIDEVFLLSDGPALAAQDRAVALAAQAAGARHVVKLSTIDVHSNVGTGPWHARGEAAVRESGLELTFLQPSGFMSNALAWASSIRKQGVLRSSTATGQIAFIDPDDIADVAVAALTTHDYDGQSLLITGPQALSYAEMAGKIGAATGQHVSFEAISDAAAYAGVVAWAGLGAYADALVDIWRAIREGRLATVTAGVQQVLGREPKSFETWVEENAAAFQ